MTIGGVPDHDELLLIWREADGRGMAKQALWKAGFSACAQKIANAWSQYTINSISREEFEGAIAEMAEPVGNETVDCIRVKPGKAAT